MKTKTITLRALDVEKLKDRSLYYLNDAEARIILFTEKVYGRTGPDLPYTLSDAIELAKEYYRASGASLVYAAHRREWIIVFDIPAFARARRWLRRLAAGMKTLSGHITHKRTTQ